MGPGGQFNIQTTADGDLRLGAPVPAYSSEHRILFYGLICISLFQLNDQWDVLLQLSANAVIHSAVAVALASMFVRAFPRNNANAILLVVGVLFAFPIAWQNTMMVMGVQFLLGILFGVLAVWGAGLYPPLSIRWFLGMLMAFAALYTSGAGLLAAAAVIGLQAFELLCTRKLTKERMITALSAGAIVITGLVMLFRDRLERSQGEFAHSFCSLFSEKRELAVYRSLFFRIGRLVASRCPLRRSVPEEGSTGQGCELLIGTGMFVLLNMAAIAYARGRMGDGPATRYLDMHLVGALVNILSVLPLLRITRSEGRGFARMAAAIWLSVIMAGLALKGGNAFVDDYRTCAGTRRSN